MEPFAAESSGKLSRKSLLIETRISTSFSSIRYSIRPSKAWRSFSIRHERLRMSNEDERESESRKRKSDAHETESGRKKKKTPSDEIAV